MTSSMDEVEGAKTELRIVTADWTYAGEELYQVYMSNICLNVSHADSVEYVTSDFVSLGGINHEFNLPYARSEDKRFTFEYALTLNGQPIAIDGDNAFTPTQAGTYSYKITSKFRNRVEAEETYEFTISDEPLILAPASYYQYDTNGKITLPAASVSADTTGKTVEYSVTNPAGTTTVLGEDRVYNTGKVHGEYTYKVAIKNGSVEEASKSATFKVQSANVFFACGNSSAGVTYEDLNISNNTFVEYTTEEAAPGEMGSMKLQQGAWSYNAAGQSRLDLSINLSAYIKEGVTKLTFWIKHNDPTNKIMVNTYAADGNGTRIVQRIHTTAGVWDASLSNVTAYSEWVPHIAGGGWYQVEIDIAQNPGGTLWLMINSDQQEFDCNLPIYISNIYYS